MAVNPASIVAPVGTEVVLMAGLCSQDGGLLINEPIEWSLSRQSVGTLVDLDKRGASFCYRTFGRKSEKLSADFAVGRTSARTQRLDRGTPTPSDDVCLLRGQTWISATSACEGVSHVTAVAPDVSNWDGRQQTATVYWLDAVPTFPPPTMARAGRKQVVTTTVARRTSGAPIAGWIVHYETVGEGTAGLNAGGGVDVLTDGAGRAGVELTPDDAQPGITRLQIQVVRPADADGRFPRLAVAQGFTSVTWSAPALAAVLEGPPDALRDSTVTYRARVSNPGDTAATDVVVNDELPDGLEFVSSNPPADVFGNRLQWRLGELGPMSARDIQFECRVTRKGAVRNCITVRGGPDLSAEACATTRVESQDIAIDMTGPDRAEVGQEVQFQVTVTNRGDDTLTGLKVLDRFDAGLAHTEPGSSIKRTLDDLAPGQSHRFAIIFTVRAAGRQCHVVEITAAGGQQATSQGCVVASTPPPQPAVEVRKTGPTQGRVGQTVKFVLVVTNTGGVPLTGLTIVDRYDEALVPEDATGGFTPRPQELSWKLALLQPGATAIREVGCRCDTASERACTRATVTTAQNVTASDELCLRIAPRDPGPIRPPDLGPSRPPDVLPEPGRDTIPPPVGTDPIEAPANGQLRLQIDDNSDPVAFGSPIVYSIALKNDRSTSDRNVSMSIFLPEGIKLEGLTGPVGAGNTSPDGRTITLTPLAELRPRETVSFRVEVSAARSGTYTIGAQVQSLRRAEPLDATETTTVNAP